jgi:hypothetical protein
LPLAFGFVGSIAQQCSPGARAGTITSRRIGASGQWSDPPHWDIGVLPNNAGVWNETGIVEAFRPTG